MKNPYNPTNPMIKINAYMFISRLIFQKISVLL